MHVDLGFKKAIIAMNRKCLRRLERMVAESMLEPGSLPPEFVEAIEEALAEVERYEMYLRQLLSEEAVLVQGQERASKIYTASIAATTEKLGNDNLTTSEREKYTDYLEELKQGQQQALDCHKTGDADKTDEANYRVMFMEQMLIMKQTKDELQQFIKNHEGHSNRIAIAALKKYGVDLQVYHKDSVIGNHCMLFGESGDHILMEMETRMMPFMNGSVQ
mmetsp:Transcript_45974/g.97602  ORF Transcript_45974/g.97602 Transcript_45974/m.97602 type:complete len:219 (+) Transcript_45974:158-814(+)